MKYEQKVTIPARVETVTHFVSPCFKCNGDKMDVGEYEDNQGPPISWVECRNCKNKQRVIGGGIKEAIRLWNENNDISTMIEVRNKQIEKLNNEIQSLTTAKTLPGK